MVTGVFTIQAAQNVEDSSHRMQDAIIIKFVKEQTEVLKCKKVDLVVQSENEWN